MTSLPTPYYRDDHCTIYHGDCRDVLPGLSEIDLIFTSPPYNLGSAPWAHLGHWKPGQSAGGNGKWKRGGDSGSGFDYSDHKDNMPWVEYVDWQRALLDACWQTLTDAGAIFYNHKPRVVGTDVWLPLDLNPGLPLRQIITWARAGGVNCTPVSYMSTSEWILLFAKPAFRLRSQSASGVGDVWSVQQERNDEHPAPFPVALPARAIETTAPDLVLDPMMGIGSTLRAAKDAGVRAIGIEKSERYCEIAAKRLAQEVLF